LKKGWSEEVLVLCISAQGGRVFCERTTKSLLGALAPGLGSGPVA